LHQLDQLTLLERVSASELKRKASEAKTKFNSSDLGDRKEDAAL